MCRLEWHFWNQIGKLCSFWLKLRIRLSRPQYGLNQIEKRESKIILSVKTYNKRYGGVPEVLKSLVLQTVKPDKIIVWLDNKCDDNLATEEMLEYEKYGVSFQYTTLDIKPHGKYFYAMQEYPDDIIITVDDDLIYPPNLIKKLLNEHIKYPEAICAWRVHAMTLKNERIAPYDEWIYEARHIKEPSYQLLATGGAGALYPPHLLPMETYNVKNIKDYCLSADDIWMKVMEMKNNIPVVWVKNYIVMPPIVRESQQEALSMNNVINGQNDIYLESLQRVYPDVFARMEEMIKEEIKYVYKEKEG